ncbi:MULTISPECIES: PAS domain-containing sensor histidine kinase [Catenuloplanes]|uniref:histidine kinase n=1 Tax=Catenuloplanes niger TaxID=587534 RepID=A0AAE3ZTN1_9ACTN|nr:ATP-binding protein [Catenuloplanes niger]MDR7325657.1 PAS domain S-box-containing protein [Catenuloplanes niger]
MSDSPPPYDELLRTVDQQRAMIRSLTRDMRTAKDLVARNMDDAVVITDEAGVIEWVNPAFSAMTGWSEAEAVGRTRQSMLAGVQPLGDLGDHLSDDHQGMVPDFLATTRDGREYWLKIELHRVHEDDGRVRIVCVEHDVTSRREADETLLTAIERSEALATELSTEKALLDGVLSSIPQLTYWKDFAGCYRGHNAAFLAMRGLDAGADVLGRTEAELPVTDELSRVLPEVEAQVLATGRPVLDQRVTMGPSRSLLLSVLPRRGTAGVIEGLIGVGADVTRVSELERQLNAANRLEAIGQLAAGIAHEINTPIQFVSDNTRFVAESFDSLLRLVTLVGEACAADGRDPAEAMAGLRAALDTIDLDFLVEEIPGAVTESLEGLDRVAQIVRAMKDFSHPGQGRRDTDINRAVESTAQVARNEWKYQAQLHLDLGPDVGQVPCYEGELKQVVLNLIVNAAHAIESRRQPEPDAPLGTITITTRRYADTVEIVVTDDGSGMTDAVRERIFDPFFTTKGVGKGTGQGLSMAYSSIVQKHGGAIRVESAPGEGARFTVCLPVSVEVPA